MTPPRLIVGTGNPGSEYEDNRHNLGFWFVDRLARELKISLSAQGKFFGRVGRLDDLWLLQPATFARRSGQAVVALARFYKIFPDEILVIRDELDFTAGQYSPQAGRRQRRAQRAKGHPSPSERAGFLAAALGHRTSGERNEVVNVLKAPRKEEQELIDHALDRCLLASPNWAPAITRRLSVCYIRRARQYDAGKNQRVDNQNRTTNATHRNLTMSLKCGIVGLPNVGKSTFQCADQGGRSGGKLSLLHH